MVTYVWSNNGDFMFYFGHREKKIKNIQFRWLALKSPPLGPKWGRWAKKLGCASDPPVCSLLVWEDRMRTLVFSPTYPTWALVGGTSRPAGETVNIKLVDISAYFSSSLVLQWNQKWQMWDFSKPETISVEHRLDLHQKPEEASSFYISPTNNPFHKHFGLSQIRINLCDTKTIFIPLDVNITWICFYRINHQKVWSSQQKQSSSSTGLGEESPSSPGMMVTSAANWLIGEVVQCTITEKAPTRAFSWLKAPTSAFTFKTLLRHYAKWALTPR